MRTWSTTARAVAAAAAVLLSSATLATGTAQASTVSARKAAATGEVTPVAKVEVARYLGDWNQVAAIPAIFEAQCAKDSRAHYVVASEGVLGVTNSCTTWWGTTSSVKGKARVDNAPQNSALSVSFLSVLGKQVYTGTNYVVFGLDKNYQWALVGDPSHSSGFVLARNPKLTASQTRTIKALIKGAGYDDCVFKVTPTTGGLTGRGSFC